MWLSRNERKRVKMNTSDKLAMLDDVVRYSTKAKLTVHSDLPSYQKNIVMAYSTAKALFESLKGDSS